MVDIQKSLIDLGIKKVNNGSSTGSKSYGGGKKINSFSPVDGKMIASVTETTEEEYDKIAPVIACTLPALTDSLPKGRERSSPER